MSDKSNKTPPPPEGRAASYRGNWGKPYSREANLANAYEGHRIVMADLVKEPPGRISRREAMTAAVIGNVLNELRHLREDVATLRAQVSHAEKREQGDLTKHHERVPRAWRETFRDLMLIVNTFV